MPKGGILPADWEASASDFQYGRDIGLDDVQISCEIENLKLWAWANSNRAVARKSNWNMALKFWLKRVATQRNLKPREKQQNDWSEARRKLKKYSNGGGAGGGSVPPALGLFPGSERE